MTSAETVATTVVVTEQLLALASAEQVAALISSIEQPTPVLIVVESA